MPIQDAIACWIDCSQLRHRERLTKTTDQRMIAPVTFMEDMAEMYRRLGRKVSCYKAFLWGFELRWNIVHWFGTAPFPV